MKLILIVCILIILGIAVFNVIMIPLWDWGRRGVKPGGIPGPIIETDYKKLEGLTMGSSTPTEGIVEVYYGNGGSKVVSNFKN